MQTQSTISHGFWFEFSYFLFYSESILHCVSCVTLLYPDKLLDSPELASFLPDSASLPPSGKPLRRKSGSHRRWASCCSVLLVHSAAQLLVHATAELLVLTAAHSCGSPTAQCPRDCAAQHERLSWTPAPGSKLANTCTLCPVGGPADSCSLCPVGSLLLCFSNLLFPWLHWLTLQSGCSVTSL